MGLEKSSTIEELISSWPLNSDQWKQGDDHLRNIKYLLKKQFPGKNGNGFNKAITATEDQLNFVEGVTSPIQEQFDELPNEYLPISGGILTGELGAEHQIAALRDTSETSNPYTGFTIYGDNGVRRGAFLENDEDPHKALFIFQEGINSSNGIDTAIKISEGLVNVSSPSGRGTSPKIFSDLTNKQYVDDTVNDALQGIPPSLAALTERMLLAESMLVSVQNALQVAQDKLDTL